MCVCVLCVCVCVCVCARAGARWRDFLIIFHIRTCAEKLNLTIYLPGLLGLQLKKFNSWSCSSFESYVAIINLRACCTLLMLNAFLQ